MIDLIEHLAQEVSEVQSGGSWADMPQDILLSTCSFSHSLPLSISYWLLSDTRYITLDAPFISLNTPIFYFALIAYGFPSIAYLTVLA